MFSVQFSNNQRLNKDPYCVGQDKSPSTPLHRITTPKVAEQRMQLNSITKALTDSADLKANQEQRLPDLKPRRHKTSSHA